jgi:hypothetical protein
LRVRMRRGSTEAIMELGIGKICKFYAIAKVCHMIGKLEFACLIAAS